MLLLDLLHRRTDLLGSKRLDLLHLPPRQRCANRRPTDLFTPLLDVHVAQVLDPFSRRVAINPSDRGDRSGTLLELWGRSAVQAPGPVHRDAWLASFLGFSYLSRLSRRPPPANPAHRDPVRQYASHPLMLAEVSAAVAADIAATSSSSLSLRRPSASSMRARDGRWTSTDKAVVAAPLSALPLAALARLNAAASSSSLLNSYAPHHT